MLERDISTYNNMILILFRALYINPSIPLSAYRKVVLSIARQNSTLYDVFYRNYNLILYT